MKMNENGLITKNNLPLNKAQQEMLRGFCYDEMKAGRLWVYDLEDGLPKVLYRDWIDETLDPYQRAHEHIHVDPIEWIETLEKCCDTTINLFWDQYKNDCSSYRGRIIAFEPLRGALAYAFSLANLNIHQCRARARRFTQANGSLKTEWLLPLSPQDQEILKNLQPQDKVLIVDPMLASGTTMLDSCELMIQLGVRPEQLFPVVACAAPEGISNIKRVFPGIPLIITYELGDFLDEDAYIHRGLGDAGAKYCRGNSMKRFRSIKHTFTTYQWCYMDRQFN